MTPVPGPYKWYQVSKVKISCPECGAALRWSPKGTMFACLGFGAWALGNLVKMLFTEELYRDVFGFGGLLVMIVLLAISMKYRKLEKITVV